MNRSSPRSSSVLADRIQLADQRDGMAANTDILWTSLALARYRSALLDEGVRMVTEVVAARTGTDRRD